MKRQLTIAASILLAAFSSFAQQDKQILKSNQMLRPASQETLSVKSVFEINKTKILWTFTADEQSVQQEFRILSVDKQSNKTIYQTISTARGREEKGQIILLQKENGYQLELRPDKGDHYALFPIL